MTSHQPPAGALPALGLAGVIVLLGFHAGAFFPGTVALAAVALGLTLVLRVALAARPFAGVSVAFVLGAAAIGAFALWALLSSTWSHAPARSIVEYDRVLLYLLAFVVFGAAGRAPGSLRWTLRAIAAAASYLCLCGLITYLLPDVWQIAPSLTENANPGGPSDRLSYPLTYGNAMGLLAGIGAIACAALTSDVREAPAGRVLAAAALPVLGVALLLTFSRGAIAASAVGLLALLAVARPRALLGAAPAAVATAVAVAVAYRTDDLAAGTPAEATAQGQGVALVLVLCVVVAAAGRAALLRLDARRSERPSPQAARRSLVGLVAAVALGAVVAGALGAPATVQRQYQQFVNGDPVNRPDTRERLTQSGDNGRLDQWRVALDDVGQAPVRGQGAGTFTLSWDRQQSAGDRALLDAHSLYIEVLGELGVVGLLLVVSALLLVLGGFLARARGPDRVVSGALFGCGLAWALAAGVDWIWEVPAVTVWLFAAGGLALARDTQSREAERAVASRIAMRWPLRLALAIVCLALLLLPARFYLSDRSLSEGERAFARDDCATTVKRVSDSIARLDVRPESHQLIGFCQARMGEPRRAVRALAEAVRDDPDNWETHYGLALTRAAAGLDPRPEARVARRLRPGESRTQYLLRLFDTDDPAQWRRRAFTGATLLK